MLRRGVGTRVKEEIVNPDMGKSTCKGKSVEPHQETQTSGSKTSLREYAGLNCIFLCFEDTLSLWDPSLYMARVPTKYIRGQWSTILLGDTFWMDGCINKLTKKQRNKVSTFFSVHFSHPFKINNLLAKYFRQCCSQLISHCTQCCPTHWRH